MPSILQLKAAQNLPLRYVPSPACFSVESATGGEDTHSLGRQAPIGRLCASFVPMIWAWDNKIINDFYNLCPNRRGFATMSI